MLEVFETLHAQAYGFLFVQCAWNSLVWMLCAESMGLLYDGPDCMESVAR